MLTGQGHRLSGPRLFFAFVVVVVFGFFFVFFFVVVVVAFFCFVFFCFFAEAEKFENKRKLVQASVYTLCQAGFASCCP